MVSVRPARLARKTGGGHGRPLGAAAPKAETDVAKYSIRVTSRRTAIELDTLRMWERRYGFPRPERTRGGSRVYSEADVEALRLIKRALDQGYRAGEVVGKSLEELTRLVVVSSQAPSLVTGMGSPTPATILDALDRDEVALLRAELRRAAVMLGPKKFLVEVAHPTCVRVGELWAEGKLEVRHEHLLSEYLAAQLRVLMAAYEERPGAPRVLLSTLPYERHGLGLAMAEVYLAASQVTPVVLGVETPPEQIVKAARSHAVDAVGLLVTQASDPKTTKNHVRWLLRELPRRVSIWIGGAGGASLGVVDDSVRIVATWSQMDAAIATLAGRGA
jgi:DNA-binding transcriptional MerR regulator/methylmalonyl-CoA mutase cobalamin-binding subunit